MAAARRQAGLHGMPSAGVDIVASNDHDHYCYYYHYDYTVTVTIIQPKT